MKVALGEVKLSGKQKAYVGDALDANQLSSGRFMGRLGSLIGESHGAKHVIIMSSGTSALRASLLAPKELKGWPDGAEVIVPATTFIATVAAVRQAGLTPVLCDVRPDDANIDVSKIGGSITPKTVAILPVHLLGRACDGPNLMSLSDEFDLAIVEDCCEAIGVSQLGRPVGSWGLAGAISTYVCHHFSTGVGGAVLTNNDDIATICRSLMVHGRDCSKPKTWKIDRWGFSDRITEMEAALGVGEIEECPIAESREKRRSIAVELLSVFSKWPDRIAPQGWPEGANPLFYPIMCESTKTRDGLQTYFDEHDIETRRVMSLLDQPIVLNMLKEQGKSPDQFPVACQWRDRAFLVGCHPSISGEQIEHIRTVTDSYFSGTP